MTVIARLETIPVHEGSMATDVARAIDVLERFDVGYQTTPMGTILEADTLDEIFAAARAAHDAVDGERVITSLEIDDHRGRPQHGAERVESVERELGRPTRGERSPREAPPQAEGASPAAPTGGYGASEQSARRSEPSMAAPRGDEFERAGRSGSPEGRDEPLAGGTNGRERRIRDYERRADRSVDRQRDQRRDRSGRGYRRY